MSTFYAPRGTGHARSTVSNVRPVTFINAETSSVRHLFAHNFTSAPVKLHKKRRSLGSRCRSMFRWVFRMKKEKGLVQRMQELEKQVREGEGEDKGQGQGGVGVPPMTGAQAGERVQHHSGPRGFCEICGAGNMF